MFVSFRGLLCRSANKNQTTKSHEPGIMKRHKDLEKRAHKLLQTVAALFGLLSGRSLSASTFQPLRCQKVPSEYSTRLMITAARNSFPESFARVFTLTTSLGPTRLKICKSLCRSGLISAPHLKRRCVTLLAFATSVNSYSQNTF